MAGAATYIETAITQILTNFVTTKSAALCAALVPIALTGTTLYVVAMGYAVMRGETHDALHTVLWKWLKVSMIAAIALGGGEYQAIVVNLIDGIPGVIHDVFGGASTMGGLVDSLTDPIISVKKALWTKASMGVFPDFALVAAAGLVNLSELIIIVVAIGIYMLAKVGLGLVLAIGPLFVMCLMWPATKRFFEAWLGTALSLAFTQALLGAAIGMLFTIIGQFADELKLKANTTDVLTDAGSLLAITVVIGVIVLRIPGIAAQMAGGSSLDGVGRDIARGLSNLIGGRGTKRGASSPPQAPENQIKEAELGRRPNTSEATTGGATRTSDTGGTSVPLYRRPTLDFIRKAGQ